MSEAKRFALILGDSSYLYDECEDPDIKDEIYVVEDPLLIVVEGEHEEFKKNLVSIHFGEDIGEEELFKGKDGMLYHFTQWYTKEEIMKKWERRG